MTGFENFIYMLGMYTFVIGGTSLLFWVVHLIEHPRGRKK